MAGRYRELRLPVANFCFSPSLTIRAAIKFGWRRRSAMWAWRITYAQKLCQIAGNKTPRSGRRSDGSHRCDDVCDSLRAHKSCMASSCAPQRCIVDLVPRAEDRFQLFARRFTHRTPRSNGNLNALPNRSHIMRCRLRPAYAGVKRRASRSESRTTPFLVNIAGTFSLHDASDRYFV